MVFLKPFLNNNIMLDRNKLDDVSLGSRSSDIGEQPEPQDVCLEGRRRFTNLFVLGSLGLLTGVSGCKRKKDPQIERLEKARFGFEVPVEDVERVNPRESDIVIERSPELGGEFPELGIEYEFVSEAADIDTPNFPEGVSKETEEKIYQWVSKQAEEGFRNFVIPNLGDDIGTNSTLFRSYIAQTAQMISELSPESKYDMDRFAETWDKLDPTGLISKINQYLIPGGLYFEVSLLPGGFVEANMRKVDSVSTVKITDGSGVEEIPVLHTGKGFVDRGKARDGSDVIATTNQGFDYAVMYDDEKKPVVRRVYDDMKSGGHVPADVSFEEFEKGACEDFLKHEAMHVFIARKFPKAGRMIDRSMSVNVPFGIDLGAGFNIDLSGEYAPIMFQELCGVGIQIAQNKTEVPYSALIYFYLENQGSYHLVTKILPLAVLKAAPDSLLKRQIMNNLSSEGSVNYGMLEQLIKSDEFTSDHMKAAGRYLFMVGIELLEQTEKAMN